jgi:hypothetical protein
MPATVGNVNTALGGKLGERCIRVVRQAAQQKMSPADQVDENTVGRFTL